MRKVFLDNLIRYEEGIDKGKINWGASVGLEVNFIYEDIQGIVKIIKYIKYKSRLTIEYKGKPFEIATGNFKKGKIGGALRKITSDFKIEIGKRFKDHKRDLIIIEREIREKHVKKSGKPVIYSDKWYKYYCNRCGYDKGWIVESNLLGLGSGCVCCCVPPRLVVEGINDIPTKEPWMVKYFQGGYEEAKLYTPQSNQSIYPICPDCGRVKSKKVMISGLYRQHLLPCSCRDSVSYPEKVIFNILEQLRVDFQTQLSKRNFDWCGKYKYDFYFKLDGKEYIVETHGEQHYKDSFYRIKSNTNIKNVLKVKENDEYKMKLALSNGIKEDNYIIIDCRKSELEWIRENIKKSNLNKIFDLSKINWLNVQEWACSNLVKKACELKKNNPDMTTTEIGEIMKHDRHTIGRWLRQGNAIWCSYVAKEEFRKNIRNNSEKLRKRNSKEIQIFKDGLSLGRFVSASEIQRQSEKLFDVKLLSTGITRVCRKERNQYKGFIFKYVDD